MSEPSSTDDIENINQSTEVTLTALTEQIDAFVREGTLDSRCAANLIKRLKKEAAIIAGQRNSSSSGRETLQRAFDTADAALREHDASLLVAAYAALRAGAADDVPHGGV